MLTLTNTKSYNSNKQLRNNVEKQHTKKPRIARLILDTSNKGNFLCCTCREGPVGSVNRELMQALWGWNNILYDQNYTVSCAHIECFGTFHCHSCKVKLTNAMFYLTHNDHQPCLFAGIPISFFKMSKV